MTERAPIDWSLPLETEDGRKVKRVHWLKGQPLYRHVCVVESLDGSLECGLVVDDEGRRLDDNRVWIRNVAPPKPAPVRWRVFNEDGSDCRNFDDEAKAQAEYDRRIRLFRGASPVPRKFPVIQPIHADAPPIPKQEQPPTTEARTLYKIVYPDGVFYRGVHAYWTSRAAAEDCIAERPYLNDCRIETVDAAIDRAPTPSEPKGWRVRNEDGGGPHIIVYPHGVSYVHRMRVTRLPAGGLRYSPILEPVGPSGAKGG